MALQLLQLVGAARLRGGPVLLIACAVGCAPLREGQLPAGRWSGPHFDLTVEDDGTGTLEGDCGSADIPEPIVADHGALHLDLDWAPGGGPVFVDTGDTGRDTVPATLDATVRAQRIHGTFTVQGSTSDVDLRLGAKSQLLRCL